MKRIKNGRATGAIPHSVTISICATSTYSAEVALDQERSRLFADNYRNAP